MTGPAEVRPASAYGADTLLELTVEMRRELLRRGERIRAEWPEEAVRDLRTGALDGFVLDREGPRAFGILSRREGRGFGHIHTLFPDEPASESVVPLLRGMIAGLPSGVHRVDFGVSGVPEGAAPGLNVAIAADPAFEIVERFRLVRPVTLANPPGSAPWPDGYALRPSEDIVPERLAEVDWAAFQGSPDAAFLADSPEGNHRLLAGVLAGQIGRFLPEASFAVLAPEGSVAGFLLTIEESPRVGLFADLAVHPAHRRRGLARGLLTQGLRALLALGHGEAGLWVTATNEPARNLYERLGFRPSMTTAIYRWRSGGSRETAPSRHSPR